MNTVNKADMAIEKIRRSSKAAAIVTRILFILTIAIMTLLIISAIAMNVSETPYAETEENGKIIVATTGGATAQCIEGILDCVIFGAIMFVANMMFTEILKEGTPFRDKVVGRLRIIAILLMAYAVVPNFFGCVISSLLTPGGFFDNIAAANLTVSAGKVFFSLMFFLIMNIFSYGCLLQEESDGLL